MFATLCVGFVFTSMRSVWDRVNMMSSIFMLRHGRWNFGSLGVFMVVEYEWWYGVFYDVHLFCI